jgi:hypothetical protein
VRYRVALHVVRNKKSPLDLKVHYRCY